MTTTVLLGKGELAVRAAAWLRDSPSHDLAAVVPVVPEPTWTTSLTAWCRESATPYVDSGHYRDLGGVLDRPIDLAISIFYDKIIPAEFIASCGRIVNLHNGPLPRYRGVSPINWALKNGEHSHGATIHEITPGIDDGPIYAQTTYSIHPEFDEVVDVLDRSVEFGWTLFTTTMPILDRITPREQQHDDATYFSRSDDHLLGSRRSFTMAASTVAAQVT